jgi:hypothetical protein
MHIALAAIIFVAVEGFMIFIHISKRTVKRRADHEIGTPRASAEAVQFKA